MNCIAPVVTVDGPSGAGKGTICLRVASTMGWHLLDSGAIYRLLALAGAEHGFASDDGMSLVRIARDLNIEFKIEGDVVRSLLDGRCVDQELRTEECGRLASQVAAIDIVRTALLDRQRCFRQHPGLVADGRDMGTVVFPDARCKIYLTASAHERAKRRQKQLLGQGIDVTISRLLQDIMERDERDSTRANAPLKPASTALILDTTELTIEQAVNLVFQHMQKSKIVVPTTGP